MSQLIGFSHESISQELGIDDLKLAEVGPWNAAVRKPWQLFFWKVYVWNIQSISVFIDIHTQVLFKTFHIQVFCFFLEVFL